LPGTVDEPRLGDPHEADEVRLSWYLHGPEAEGVRRHERANALGHRPGHAEYGVV
jgi:hypothetical protein